MTYAGFYGKLASRGDFVSRDLPPSFIQPWDQWLAAGLNASQQQLGNDWLPAYLVSPLWRFALAPGVCGPQAVVGVLMPSIDRVGRYFPLTVALPLEAAQGVGPWLEVEDWFEQAEALMLDSLEADARFEAFEVGLQSLPLPEFEAVPEQDYAGASLWWGRGNEHIAPGLRRFVGLPAAADFARALLGFEGLGHEGQG
ncbi:type VI secretion system-associated protein TagF [Pseudomonas sp. 3A(2025)]